MSPGALTLQQINEVSLADNRPVLICDVDEVVVHFIQGLEGYLLENKMRLRPDSFALNGNIRRLADDQPISTDDLRFHIDRFFEQKTEHLEPITGAVAGLQALAEYVEIIMLTNLPAAYRDARIANLKTHGLDFPVIVNEGAKGPAIAKLVGQSAFPTFFIDDLPHYLQSAREHVADIELIHFMQDKRFARHLPELDYVSLSTDSWARVVDYILARLKDDAPRY